MQQASKLDTLADRGSSTCHDELNVVRRVKPIVVLVVFLEKGGLVGGTKVVLHWLISKCESVLTRQGAVDGKTSSTTAIFEFDGLFKTS